MKIPIKRFDKSYPLPTANSGAACFDFICRETVTIQPGQIKAVAQNVALKVPEGHAFLMFVRSSTPLRKGVVLANGVGVIDPFYCGDKDEFLAFLLNITDKPVTIAEGDKVVQGMFVKFATIAWEEVDALRETGHDGYQHDTE
jgi:dUTP pyrophosphatase